MNNQDLLNRSLKSVWHPCTQMKAHETLPLLPIASGEGVWLKDFEGKRYLDGVSSWWVNLFGHNEPRIKAAISEQLNTLEHVMLAGFTHAPVVQLSEKLGVLTGLGHCFYASDGASATEIALKMSFHYWRNIGQPEKNQFLSLQNSYHGETIGALSVTDVAIFKDTYAPLLRQSAQMPSPDARLAESGESAEAYANRCADFLEAYIKQHHADIAAFIIEPLIQCAAGMGMYSSVYLKRAGEICSQYQVHLIADEIAVGFGRTGTMFACEQANIKPDFICLSKGITAGYLPLSVTLTTDKIYEAFYDDSVARGFLHSHSYTGNALACSAALATLAIFEQDDVLSKNQTKTAYINNQISTWHDLPIAHVRNQGMIWAFDVQTNNQQFQRAFYQQGLEKGLLLRPIGHTVYWMPPYVISQDEIDFMVNTTKQLVTACA
ncbi:adenosylmethionine--8-amino-7-oxononanoate transaminase [Candidatus Methylopumilus turicensis]|uniref:Adenosylmethionine-8-amino-7-oxononanoate aminotransferase n=1 Tax=Candidatus Methylopumilus turicensis TaxID=1581680 RepID=A0A0B7IY52_9PROT|nr:adenosylmethionine--8-amino-7-oxononanoate transaminase [Candidatus Methylopumilus turicensis]CEN55356.1 Adenosylmethionine-8-amino-7-oxononanoate aminotransferase [Candidatus Methylopumilus turicensis]